MASAGGDSQYYNLDCNQIGRSRACGAAMRDACSIAVRKVLDYCKFHKDEPPAEIQKPLKSANLAECGVREWDVEYVDVEQEILFELILAANYLDIKALLDLTCAKVASAFSAAMDRIHTHPGCAVACSGFYAASILALFPHAFCC